VDFSIIFNNFGLYLQGLQTTLTLVAVSLAIGLGMAIPLALVAHSGPWWARGPVFCFSYFFRGTPLLVQMFMIYYGAGQFEAIRGSFLWPVLQEAYWCALIAFTLNTAAYTIEILRGAIQSTPHGEIEAAVACGMSRAVMIRRIILPSAFRRALPATATR
jgi:arginine/ornithine transport system permease protein